MPARAPAQDLNATERDFAGVEMRVGLVCPAEISAGKSNLAIQIFYDIARQSENIACERIFLPPLAARQQGAPPVSRETGRFLREFDLLAASVSFELEYPNLIWMLQKGGIPPDFASRSKKPRDFPFVLLGGIAVAANPAPMRPCADAIFVGEADLAFHEILQDCLETPRQDWGGAGGLGKIPGMLPAGRSAPVKRVRIPNLDLAPYPIAQVIPHAYPRANSRKHVSPLKDSFLLEVNRGCPNWCRFCLAGHVTRPFRNRSLARLREILQQGIAHTPTKKVTLIGSAVADYPELPALLREIHKMGLRFSIPSVRLDCLDEDMLSILRANDSKSITIAPETACEATRRAAGKDWSNETIFESVAKITKAGIQKIKIYLLIGLPETLDVESTEIPPFIRKMRRRATPNAQFKVSVNPFVPKAHTPFAGCVKYYFNEGFEHISRSWRSLITAIRKIPNVEVEGYDPRWARVQAYLSLAGTEAFSLLVDWAGSDLTLGSFRRSLHAQGIDLDATFRNMKHQVSNPWDIVDNGVRSGVLEEELRSSAICKCTTHCVPGCRRCGLCVD